MSSSRRGWAFLLLCAFPLAIHAQQTFRSSTVLVEVDAIVTDGQSRFVADLRPDDFEVLEEGKSQTIARMYIVDGRTVTNITSPAAVLNAGVPPAAPVPAPQRVFVLVFDQDHLQPGAFKRLKDAATAFLTKEFQPGDVGGIVVGGTMAGNRLTSDREELLAAVRDAKPSGAKASRRLDMFEWPRLNGETEAIRIALAHDRDALDQAVRRACEDDPTMCRQIDPAPAVMQKARDIVNELRPAAKRTVMTLQALTSGLARLPGRKTLVLMTEGFFVEESWADLRQIVGAAARSNVRIYSLDAGGIETRQATDLRVMGPSDPGGGIPLDGYNTSEDGPNMLAVDTGGRAIRHTNQFADALRQIADDTSRYYVIGYSPSELTSPGTFRRITVRVKRPGLRVRARRGYLASAPAPVTTTAAASTPVPEASDAPAAPAPGAAGALSPEAARAPSAPVTAHALPSSAIADATIPRVLSTAGTDVDSSALRLRPDANNGIRELASNDEEFKSGRDLAAQGWNRYQKGDLEGAADLLGKAAAAPSPRPWVEYALGYAELGLRHPDTAARAWEKVRAEVPEFRSVYLDLADAYMQMDDFGRAIDVLKAAGKKWPADVEILNAMGTIQVRRGALDDAIRTFKRATDAEPDDGLAWFNLGRTYELKFFKMRRYIQSEARWISNPSDLKNAIASYSEYMKHGGPYTDEARIALQNLQWMR